MSMILRSSRRITPLARQVQQVRLLHIENTVDNTIPGGSKKGLGFALRFWGLFSVGATLPFAACELSQRKAAGAGSS